jgi:hypothetical protein
VSVRRASLLFLVAALLAGCGGGPKSYTAKADDICKKYSKQTNALGNAQSITRLAQLAQLADKTLPILDRAAKELAALEPPPDKRAAVRQWLAQFGKLRADVREIRDKAKAGDRTGVAAIALQAQQDNAKANELGASIGFNVCDKT